MALRVKLCGFSEPESLEAALQSGVDAVGFVLDPSPRQLTLDQAADLMARVPPHVDAVAVVGRPDLQTLRAIAERLDPSWIQIMADALPPIADRAGLRLLPAFDDGPDIAARIAAYRGECGEARPKVLADWPRPGSGIPADWDRLATLAEDTQLILAGGINAHNVADAVAKVRPYGIDLCSGVENEAGHKDPLLIRQFMAAVKGLEASP